MDKKLRFARVAQGSPRLTVQIRHRLGALAIDADFLLTNPWTVLFGPSGSGKSTILRAIAGLAKPDSGKLQYAVADNSGQQWLQITMMDSAIDQFVPSHSRMLPLAPQSPDLFPHWSVADNLTMQRKLFGRSNADAEEVLPLFHLDHLRNKLPIALSGGEAQRVNLARAAMWTVEGGLLLLDEPFTGMDTSLRDEIIRNMQVWMAKRNVCVLSVTHNVAEAFQLNAEVIKIADGKVIAQGPVDLVLAEERLRLLQQLHS